VKLSFLRRSLTCRLPGSQASLSLTWLLQVTGFCNELCSGIDRSGDATVGDFVARTLLEAVASKSSRSTPAACLVAALVSTFPVTFDDRNAVSPREGNPEAALEMVLLKRRSWSLASYFTAPGLHLPTASTLRLLSTT